MTGAPRWLAPAAILLLHAALLALVWLRAPGVFLQIEEDYVAFAAIEIAGGAEGWTTYVKTTYEHGALLLALLAVPLFAALGPSLVALKLIGAALNLATVAAVMALGMRWYGRRAGLVAGLLLACGPVGWVAGGTQTLGDLLDGLVLCVVPWLLLRPEGTPLTTRRALALGALLGLAVTFSLAALPVAAALVVCAVAGGRLDARAGAAGVAGGLAGLALPLWNLGQGVTFYHWRGRGLTTMVGWSPIEGLAALLGPTALVESMMLLDAGWLALPEWQVALLAGVYWYGVLAAWLLVGARAYRERQPADVWLACWHGAVLVAFVLNRHRLSYYLILLVPSGSLLLARALEWLGERTAPRQARALLVVLLLASLSPWAGLLRRAEELGPNTAARVGERRLWLATHVGWRRAMEARLRRGTPVLTDRDEAFALGMLLSSMNATPGTVVALADAQVAGGGLPLGRGFGYAQGWSRMSLPASERLATLTGLTGAAATGAHWGLGRLLGEARWVEGALRRDPAELAALGRGLSAPRRESLYAGLGFGYGLRFWQEPARYGAPLRRFPERAWPAFERGLRRRLARDVRPGPARDLREAQLERFPLQRRDAPPGVDVGLRGDGGLFRTRGGLHDVWLWCLPDGSRCELTVGGQRLVVRLEAEAEPGAMVWLRLGALRLRAGEQRFVLRATPGRPPMAGLRLVRRAP